mgnify:CR=1 FL=1
MKTVLSIIIVASLLFLSNEVVAEDLKYYFPNDESFDSKIPTPEEFLGYTIGSRISEHSRINAYYEKLNEISERAELIEIGKTYENRPIYVLAITSPENIAKLNSIKDEREAVRRGEKVETPLIIFLGNSVHGNEISASEASLLSAFYYTASQSEKVRKQLNESIIFIDTVRNPDGQERFAS